MPLVFGMRRGAAALAAGLLLGLGGCADPPPARPRTEAELIALVREDSLDPWPHFHLAQILERRADYPQAIREYGMAINKLPPRSATRPVLALGMLHHALRNREPATRCYVEVLETVASDGRFYAANDDYKRAAAGLAALLADAEGQEARVEALRRRFLDELGGSEAAWERGPVWIKPLTPPPSSDENAPGSQGAREGRESGS